LFDSIGEDFKNDKSFDDYSLSDQEEEKKPEFSIVLKNQNENNSRNLLHSIFSQ
jgi:hypothetical protein